MTMTLVIVIFLGFLSAIFANTESLEQVMPTLSTPCTTPNNKVGVCIEIQNCSILVDALRSGKNESFDFIRESRCGPANEDPRQPKVCCGMHDNYLYKNTTLSNLARNLFPKKCGIQREDGDRIFGGTETSIGEFPWMARIRHRRNDGLVSHGCVGFLISEKFVLTAAHCIRSKTLTPLGPIYQVQLGEYNTERDTDCEYGLETEDPICADAPQLVQTAEPIVHAEYTGDRQNYNDIAIIPLKQPANFTKFVFPICLPETLSQDTIMWLAGWGKTETRHASPIKLKTQLPRVNQVQCTNVYKPTGIRILNSQICAGGEAGHDSCTGDSGGPLMVSKSSGWYAEGIVSFGKGCGEKGWPGIYTNIPYYMSWIRKVMNEYLEEEEDADNNY